ncbi:T9SS type A sorting domain-containing protein [Bacteroidota bacterium]
MKKVIILFLMLFITGFISVSAQTVDVIFTVDMSLEIGQGRFDPAEHEVQIRGDFDGWGDGQVVTALPEPDDHLYEVTLTGIATNSEINYKFLYTDGADFTAWEGDPNRNAVVAEVNLMVDAGYFNQLTADGGNATVTFNVDMSVIAATVNFDPATQFVYVAGTITDPGWGEGALEMLDADEDLVYSVEVDGLVGGTDYEFKFIYGGADPTAGTWENVANRTWLANDGAQSFTAYWDDQGPDVQFADGNILFTVNMSVMSEVGIYDPVTDGLQVRGGFNSWNDSEPDRSIMVQDPLDPNIWALNVPFEQVEIGSDQAYKFFVSVADTESIWIDGWERPISTGGGNRLIPFEGTTVQLAKLNQDAGWVYFDDVHPDWVIPDGESVDITFSVDMTDAMADAGLEAIPFDPAADTVWWVCEVPTFAVTQGWTDTDQMRVFPLLTADGNVYSGTLTVNGPSFNAFEYRYGYSHPADESFILEDAGYGTDAYRTRFISQTDARTFDQPYAAPADAWTDGVKTAQSEDAPAGYVTGVGDVDVPVEFSLEQNYPNPFNPTTKIRFTVPESGIVTLKVYNLLGQEVATLMNRDLNAGTYDVNFNATAFSSGVYFYTVRINNFTATKKMMLLK